MVEYDWVENTTVQFQHIFGGKCKMIGGFWELLECILIPQTNLTQMEVAPQEAISGWIYISDRTFSQSGAKKENHQWAINWVQGNINDQNSSNLLDLLSLTCLLSYAQNVVCSVELFFVYRIAQLIPFPMVDLSDPKFSLCYQATNSTYQLLNLSPMQTPSL